MKVSPSLLHVILLICSILSTVEITEKPPETMITKSSGPSFGKAYIQVIPLNEEAGDLHLVKTVLTDVDLFPYNESMTTITGIAATTECTKMETNMQCECETGFLFDIQQCKSRPSCDVPMGVETYCFCPHLDPNSTVYCEEPPRFPGKITLSPKLVTVGSDVVLEFSTVEDVSNIKWYLVNVLSNMIMEVHNGTRATVVTTSRKSTLTIRNIPKYWAGLYMCKFQYKNRRWQMSYMLEFPLNASDIVRNPHSVFLRNNSRNFPGITLECCIRNNGGSYYVFWEPGHSVSDPVYRGDWRCYPLSIDQIPVKDMYYSCIFRDDLDTEVKSQVYVGFLKGSDKFCPSSTDGKWKLTKAGYNAEILCARGKAGRISRSCLKNGQWTSPEESCIDTRLRTLFQQTQRIRGGMGVLEQDIPQMMETLRNYTRLSLNYIGHPSDIVTVMETMNMLSRTAVDYKIQLNAAAMTDLVTVYSQVLSFNFTTFWSLALTRQPSLGSMFLQSVETISRIFGFDSGTIIVVQPYFQISTTVMNPLSLTDYKKSFNTTPKLDVVIKNIATQSRSNITVINMVLRDFGKILPANFGSSVKGYNHSVESLVVVNTIMAGNQTVTQADLEMVFLHSGEPNETEVATAQCVFWDKSLFDGAGGWSTEGCQTLLVNDTVTCRYGHVATYSVLRSLGVSEHVDEVDALEILSQVGASLSILSLLIYIIVYIIEWKLVVKDDITFYRQMALVNIGISLLIGDVWFLTSTFITESRNNHLCISAAFFQHVFYLATLFWMLIQGFILLYQLVFSFQLIKVAVIVAMMGIGYLCPLIIASVTIGTDYPKEEYITEGTCFLNLEDGAIYAFSGPVLLVFSMNFFPIGAMIWKLLRPPQTDEPEDNEDTKSWVVRALAVLTSVFGITWFVETELWLDDVHDVYLYIITALSCFQGVDILIIGCLLDKRIREALYKTFQKFLALFRSLSCCKHGSYNVEQLNELEVPQVYRQIYGS